MTKVAALYIATGKYTVFWPEFYESAEQYLLRDCEVHYFVFTDADALPGEENPPRAYLPAGGLLLAVCHTAPI